MKTLLNDEFFNRLETLSLNMNTNLSGLFGGKHRTKAYGQTVEFADYREYQLGDDIRRIDWNLFSRFEKHYLKLFTDEKQMHVQIFLDCSASMQNINPDKADFALRVTAALGYLTIKSMDKLSFKLVKRNLAEDVCGTITGKNAFYEAISSLEALTFEDVADLEAAVTGCVDPGYNDGLTVIVSDFLTDNNWKKAVDFLLFRKRRVLIIHVLSPDELNPSLSGRTHLMDSEAIDALDTLNMKLKITSTVHRAYQEAVKYFLNDAKSFCDKRGVGYVFANCTLPVERLIFGELFRMEVIV